MASQAATVHMVAYKTNSDVNENDGYSNDNDAITVQPVKRPDHEKIQDEEVPGDNLALALFSAIFCNIILGGLAVWQSRKVNRHAKQGDYDAAKKASFWTNVLTAFALFSGGVAWIIAFRFWITEEY